VRVPRKPNRGEVILQWARDLTDYVRRNTVNEGPDIIPEVRSAGTNLRLRKKFNPSLPPQPTPFFVLPTSPPDGDSGDGWLKVAMYSMLLGKPDGSADPTAKITITGLDDGTSDSAFQLAIADDPRQYVWLDVDVSHIQDDTPTISATIANGHTWNSAGDDFWPEPVQFNSDDGTPDGDGVPDSGLIQTDLFVPIAWTFDKNDNPWDPYLPPGIDLTQPDEESGSGGIRLVQNLNSHLRLYRDCYKGNQVLMAMPWHAPWDAVDS